MSMIFRVGEKQLIFDDFFDNTEEDHTYITQMCPKCQEKYKGILGNRISSGAGCTCSVKGCWNQAAYRVDFKDTEVCFSFPEPDDLIFEKNNEKKMETKKQETTSTYSYLTTIPEDVQKAIENEVKSIAPMYEVVTIIRYKHSDDKNLYRVVAEMVGEDTYTYWDCFNASTKSLSFGHYHISLEEAMQLLWSRV